METSEIYIPATDFAALLTPEEHEQVMRGPHRNDAAYLTGMARTALERKVGFPIVKWRKHRVTNAKGGTTPRGWFATVEFPDARTAVEFCLKWDEVAPTR